MGDACVCIQSLCMAQSLCCSPGTTTTLLIGYVPGIPAGKESACNAWDPGLIPGSGRSPGEGIGYPLQYSCASLVAQLVTNLPAIRETRVRSLGWEDTLEKGKAIHSSILARRIPWTSPWGYKKSDTAERLSLHFTSLQYKIRSSKNKKSMILSVV